MKGFPVPVGGDDCPKGGKIDPRTCEGCDRMRSLFASPAVNGIFLWSVECEDLNKRVGGKNRI